MRTVKDIATDAMNLLGYTDANGNERFTRRVLNKVIPIFNAVYSDIWHIEMTPEKLMRFYKVHDHEKWERIRSMQTEERTAYLETLCEFLPVRETNEEIDLNAKAIEAITYGVAAFLAQSEDDADNQSLWMSIYNQKRTGLSHIGTVADIIPTV